MSTKTGRAPRRVIAGEHERAHLLAECRRGHSEIEPGQPAVAFDQHVAGRACGRSVEADAYHVGLRATEEPGGLVLLEEPDRTERVV